MADGEVVVNRAHVDFGDFEEDVIAEILARLPVKSLKRFRCVCKPWCSLISASYFVKKHLSYQDRGITESSRKLIFKLDPPLALDCDAFKSTEDSNQHGQFTVTPLDFPVKKTNPEFRCTFVVGSCNGLVCVEVGYQDIMSWNPSRDSRAMILWNPCTRDFTALPNPPRLSKFSNYLYGLGYDSANDDYKVIRSFVSYSVGCHGTKEIMIHILSLKTGSWKTVKDIDYVTLAKYQGLFVNGALHWLSNLPDGSGSSILSFELRTEEFQRTVPYPMMTGFLTPLFIVIVSVYALAQLEPTVSTYG